MGPYLYFGETGSGETENSLTKVQGQKTKEKHDLWDKESREEESKFKSRTPFLKVDVKG